ncbi:xylose isomerase-like protein [Desarmillaria tabescens]|uniref:Apurinic-apyrimidinic endonuclease 1 n=1 Tax=Armillaria tabescens TaxID=1929756 RepID=A0AA39JH60_ARMTA|nr:xylose isomerase-like protein [Desarmillaria tabescens]KAK0442047.1 xylose isomerase-like protein [Desarmillaria tabescens]
MLSLLRSRQQSRNTTSLLQVMARTRMSSSVSEQRPPKRARKTKINDEKLQGAEVKIGKSLASSHSLWHVGAHVSVAGGIENAVLNAASIGCVTTAIPQKFSCYVSRRADAFALFVKSPRKWASNPFKDSMVENFKARMREYHYGPRDVLTHGSYLINLGNPDFQKREKSYECLVDDLNRCQQLSLEVYNFHPGSSVGAATTAESIGLIAECLNRAHKATTSVVTVLENMAGGGHIIGSDFSHLADIIAAVEDKSRIGVCLDTCHMFAAGYDIRTKQGWDDTITKFDQQVGLSYLRGMHLNDSKTDFASNRDRHENIGMGRIGLEPFHYILTDPRVQGIPLILETSEPEAWATEIEVLNELSTCTKLDDKKKKALLCRIRKSLERAGPPYKAGSRRSQRAKKTDDDDKECDR